MSGTNPGRVYGMPGELAPGERSGMGYRFFTHTGEKVPFVQRVAFGADADEGMAAVTVAYLLHGRPVIDHASGRVAALTFRAWVRAVAPGQPDPPLAPEAVLWKTETGVVRLERDPLPDEALDQLNRAGRESAGATH